MANHTLAIKEKEQETHESEDRYQKRNTFRTTLPDGPGIQEPEKKPAEEPVAPGKQASSE